MRKLEWPSYATEELERVVRILNVINPHGYTVPQIKAHVQLEFDKGLTSYVSTAGWCVTVYEAPGRDDIWHAVPTLNPYSVEKYLNI